MPTSAATSARTTILTSADLSALASVDTRTSTGAADTGSSTAAADAHTATAVPDTRTPATRATTPAPVSELSGVPVPERSHGVGRLRTRLVAFVVALLGVAGLALAIPTAASATASTQNFYAECSPSSVQAYAPDMGWYPNYSVTWSPTLFVYTSAGWKPYLNGPTQSALGNNVSGDLTGDWIQQQVTFYGLPRGNSYQVRITAAWLGRGINIPLQYRVLVPHQRSQGNFTFAAYSNSTSSYCYIP